MQRLSHGCYMSQPCCPSVPVPIIIFASLAVNNAAPANEPVRIVIAEDSRIQAKILQKHLVGAGYEVRVAPDGAQAWEMIQQDPPTLIISDIEMPEMNGYELCRTVKSDPTLRNIPLILLSTLASPDDIIEGPACRG